MYTAIVQYGLPLPIQHPHTTPYLQTFYPPSAHFVTPFSAPFPLSYSFSCSSTPSAPSSFPDLLYGILEVFEPEVLNFLALSHFNLWILSISRNSTSICLSLSGFLNTMLCNLITLTPGLAFLLLLSCMLASSFSSGRIYSSLNSLPPLFA